MAKGAEMTVEQRQGACIDQRGGLGEPGGKPGVGPGDVHDDNGVIDKAEGEEADPGNIEDKFAFHPEGDISLGGGLKLLRVGEFAPGHKEQDQGNSARYGQHREAGGRSTERSAPDMARAIPLALADTRLDTVVQHFMERNLFIRLFCFDEILHS